MQGKLCDNRFPVRVRLHVLLACVCGLLTVWTAGVDIALGDAASDYNFAVGLYKQKRWKRAAATFRKYLEQNPKHVKVPYARLYRGLALVKAEQYQEARTELRRFVKSYPSNRNLPDAMYRVAECSYLLDDLKWAEIEFQAFLAKYPKHELVEWALPYLGDARLRLGKPQLAAVDFERSLELFPKGRMVEDSKFGLASSLEALNKSAEAIKLYEQLAADVNGERAPQAQLKLGTYYFDTGKYAEAARAYRQLEQRFSGSELVPLARLNAGYAYHQAGDYRKAIAQFDLAARDKQQTVTANYWKGISYKKLGEYQQATAVLKATFESDPKGPLAQTTLHQWADSELRDSRLDAARELFLDLVKRWPKGDLADDALHFAAEAALSAGKLDEAQELVTRFGREYPRSSLRMHHQLLQGRLLNARGDKKGADKGGRRDYQAAVEHFQQVLAATKIPATRSLARFHLARSWQKLGDHAKAVETVAPLAEQVIKEGASSELVEALVLQGTSLQALKEFENAGKAMTQYLKLRPQGSQADQALATLAVAEVHRGNTTASRLHLAALSKRFPQSPLLAPTKHELAETAYGAKDWDWALSLFRALVEPGPSSPYHASGLSGSAWCLYQKKQFADAAAAFGQVVKTHPDDRLLAPEAAYMQGQALQDGNQHAASAAAYAAAFRRFAPEGQGPAAAERKGPAYYAYRAGLQAARMLRTMKKVKEADAAYEELLGRFPKPQDLDKLLDEWALLNYEAGNYKRSDEIFRRLVEQTPNSDLVDNARLSLAESDWIAGKTDAARKAFLQLHVSPQSDPQVQQVSSSHLIGIAVERKAWQEVRKTASQLIGRFPKSKHRFEAEFYLGEAHLQLGNVEAAQQSMLKLEGEQANEAVHKAEWFPRVWVVLAETYLRQKKYADVNRTVDEFRTSDPTSEFLYQADEVLGRSLKNQAKFDAAREAFGRAIDSPAGKLTTTAAKCQLMIAETYWLQKDYENALDGYLRVYTIYKYPEWQAPALFQAALCDEALHHFKEAVQAYEDLLKHFPNSEFASKAKPRLEAARRKAAG